MEPVELFVANIPYHATAREVAHCLEAVAGGCVRKCEVQCKVVGQLPSSKGFAFVTVENQYNAETICIRSSRGTLTLQGRQLKAKMSKRKVKQQPTYSQIELQDMTLIVGNMKDENQLKPLFQAGSVGMEVTFETRTVSLYLRPDRSQHQAIKERREYKFSIKFRNIENVQTVASPRGSSMQRRRPKAILFRVYQPAHVYYRQLESGERDGSTQTIDATKTSGGFEMNELSKLLKDFFNQENENLELPMQDTLPDDPFLYNAADYGKVWTRGTDFTDGQALGRSFYYYVSLESNSSAEDINALTEIMDKLVDYKLADDPPTFMNLEVLPFHRDGASSKYAAGISLIQHAGLPADFVKVPYRVLFSVLQLLDYGKLSEFGLTPEFAQLLCGLPEGKALAALSNMWEEDEIFEPAERIREELKSLPDCGRARRLPKDLMNVHRLLVTPTRACCFGPEVDSSNRVTRKFSHITDSFLRVSFVDEDFDILPSQDLSVPVKNRAQALSSQKRSDVYFRILNILSNGVKIGNKHFKFLAFSTSQLREQSVWMFAPTNDVTPASIREWMGDFTKIRNVAKFAARMGQCFSSSRATLEVPTGETMVIPDIEITFGGTKYNFSDGIGTIKQEFANEVWRAMGMRGPVPSAFQTRYAGSKGVVAIHPLSQSRLCIRRSMQKFSSNHRGFEVLDWSRFRPGFLNRQIITLLSTLGVQDSVFIQLQIAMVKELTLMLKDPATAVKVLEAENSGAHKTALEMLTAGFDPEEPHLQAILRAFRAVRLQELKMKARIFVPKARCLMGCLDEFGHLQYGQVFLQVTRDPRAVSRWDDGLVWPKPANAKLPNGQSNPLTDVSKYVIRGKVVVAKCPCLHPGDVQLLEAVDVPALHHMVDCLVFPQNGDRPHPNECSGSDLDGDLYFVSWDEGLLPLRNVRAMDYDAAEAVQLDHPVHVEDIAKFFVDFMMNNTLGIIANACVVHADTSPLNAADPKCLQLAQLFSIAVDFPKTGIPALMPMELRPKEYPDFMEKEDKVTYVSKKVLGQLYRHVATDTELLPKKLFESDVTYDSDLVVEGFREHVNFARMCKEWYDHDIVGLMNRYGIKSEAELVTGHILQFGRYFKRRQGEARDQIARAVATIRKQIRAEFDEGVEITNVRRFWPMASAWYHVTYSNEFAEAGGRKGKGKQRLISFPWIVSDVLASIKRARKAQADRLAEDSLEKLNTEDALLT